MWAKLYDPLAELAAVHPRLIRQDATSGLFPFSRGHYLHLHVEAPAWLHATLPTWLAISQAEDHLGYLWQAQRHVPGGVKFASSINRYTLVLQGDLPLHPRALVLPRWQILQQGMVRGLRLLRRLRTRAAAAQPDTQASPSPPVTAELPEHIQAVLQEGGWSWTTQQGAALVRVSLQEHVHLVRLAMATDGILWCGMACPLPWLPAPVCQRAIHAFMLESNTRLRLVRLSYTVEAQTGVVAEVGVPPDWLDVTTLGQALEAVAVAAQLLWPVLPTLAAEDVARLYLQTWWAA